MKKLIAVLACSMAVMTTAFAAQITQTAAAVNKNLPPSVRDTQINNAVSELTKVDVPAILTSLNAIDAKTTAGITESQTIVTNITTVACVTNIVPTATTNIFSGFDAGTNVVSFTNINTTYTILTATPAAQSSVIQFLSGIATNAP